MAVNVYHWMAYVISWQLVNLLIGALLSCHFSRIGALSVISILYLRLRIQWMSEGAPSITGSVKSADRQRWSCKSSLASCRAHSDSRGAPLHSLATASTVPFSVFLCFGGAWKHCGIGEILLLQSVIWNPDSVFTPIAITIPHAHSHTVVLPDSACDSKTFRSSVASVPGHSVKNKVTEQLKQLVDILTSLTVSEADIYIYIYLYVWNYAFKSIITVQLETTRDTCL